MTNDEILVFDTGPLCAFAQNNWLGVLKAVVGNRTAVIPDVVVAELRAGVSRDSRLQAVLDAPWIERRELRSPEEVAAFASFAALLVRGRRNLGEAGVLALASTLDATAVVDDGAARKAAREQGIPLRPTLSLMVDAIRGGLLTVPLVSALADDLMESTYRLPFGPGGFEKWAREEGLLE